MKPADKDREVLLQDLLPSKEITDRLGIEEVFRLVERERAQRRKRLCCAGIALAMATVVLTASWSRHTGRDSLSEVSPVAATAPAKSQTPRITAVDDEGLLRMIDAGPAALAEWPDGRQSLLILVTHTDARDDDENTALRPLTSPSSTDGDFNEVTPDR
jgi:hypothetical protein